MTLKFISSRLSKAEILEELPKLNAGELREIHDRILQPQEADLLGGHAKPSEEEKALHDRELEDYSRNPEAGSSWEEVESRLKQSGDREMAPRHPAAGRGRSA